MHKMKVFPSEKRLADVLKLLNLKKPQNMKELNFKQELTAAFGQPISENPTQVMIEAAYRHHNLDWRYLTIEVGPDDLEDAVKGAKVMGFQGFNCTIPHKVKVIEYLDGLGQSASLMGAVNCVCLLYTSPSPRDRG